MFYNYEKIQPTRQGWKPPGGNVSWNMPELRIQRRLVDKKLKSKRNEYRIGLHCYLKIAPRCHRKEKGFISALMGVMLYLLIPFSLD